MLQFQYLKVLYTCRQDKKKHSSWNIVHSSTHTMVNCLMTKLPKETVKYWNQIDFLKHLFFWPIIAVVLCYVKLPVLLPSADCLDPPSFWTPITSFSRAECACCWRLLIPLCIYYAMLMVCLNRHFVVAIDMCTLNWFIELPGTKTSCISKYQIKLCRVVSITRSTTYQFTQKPVVWPLTCPAACRFCHVHSSDLWPRSYH